MTDRLLLRPSEAGEAIGVSRSKAYELIAAGKIPERELGGCIRVPLDGLKAWINGQVKEQAESR